MMLLFATFPLTRFYLLLIAHCFKLIASYNERPSPKHPERTLKGQQTFPARAFKKTRRKPGQRKLCCEQPR